MAVWSTILWLSLGWAAFAYVGYPLCLWLLARVSPRPVRSGDHAPSLCLVVTAYNEESSLRAKLENALALGYPGPFELWVASDGSTDATAAIAREFAPKGVRLVELPERRGKEAAQAAAIRRAEGDVLVFTDAAARLEPGALRAVVRPFADPAVGCVTSEDVVDPRAGEGAYVRYEMMLRRLESRVGSVVGLSGSFFAVRRALCDPWPEDLASDFRVALETIRRGFRAVTEPAARARFGTARDVGQEWRRRVRTARRGLAVLAAHRDLLHPRHGRDALALWGHKVARFTAPFALAGALVASAVLAPVSAVAAALLAAQVAFWGVALAALAAPPLARTPLVHGVLQFALMNLAAAVAWVHHLRGARAVTWEPTRR